jgi:hypothetical protein
MIGKLAADVFRDARRDAAFAVLAHAAHAQGHFRHADALAEQVDERLLRVRVAAKQRQAICRFTIERAEAAAHIGEARPAAHPVDDAGDGAIPIILHGRHDRTIFCLGEARAGNEVGLVALNGSKQMADVVGIELAVTVDVADDVRAASHGALEPVTEDVTETRSADQVYHDRARAGGNFGGAVGRAVVHDDHLDFVDSGNVARYACDHLRDRLFLILRRDCNDEFHAASAHLGRVSLRRGALSKRLGNATTTVHLRQGSRFLPPVSARASRHGIQHHGRTGKARVRGNFRITGKSEMIAKSSFPVVVRT